MALGIAALAVLGASCVQEQAIPTQAETTGSAIPTRDFLLPATPPPSRGVVTLSGTPFQVQVLTHQEEGRFVIKMVKDGEEFDVEEYENSVEAFRLVKAGGEAYSPPIDLLRYPMKVGESWTWKGHISAQGHDEVASAKVDTALEKQFVSGVAIEAIRVRVVLNFRSMQDYNEQTERVLTFWVAEKLGVFRRSYDTVSVREPEP